jgi:hypothetical protein
VSNLLRRFVLFGGGIVLGAAAVGLSVHDRHEHRQAALPPVTGARLILPSVPGPPRLRPVRHPSRPVRISIPAIGINARVIRLGLNPDRTLQTPKQFSDTGWWSGGAKPGARGPAVIVGHVDSYTGPAVFFRLTQLQRGDRIAVRGANGHTVRFVVRRLASFRKARFPTRLVYGLTRRPTLRLVTCSGAFDRATGHYLDNTIVFASLV